MRILVAATVASDTTCLVWLGLLDIQSTTWTKTSLSQCDKLNLGKPTISYQEKCMSDPTSEDEGMFPSRYNLNLSTFTKVSYVNISNLKSKTFNRKLVCETFIYSLGFFLP